MKFSELISELTEIWLLWMKHNAIVRDDRLSFEERKESASVCEKLINREYEITDQIDWFFEK